VSAERAQALLKPLRRRLGKRTRDVLDLLLRGDSPTQERIEAVEEECNRVWRESGRRSSTTRCLAAHEAVEAYLAEDYATAIRAASFAQ
jgi:hypothetical protein